MAFPIVYQKYMLAEGTKCTAHQALCPGGLVQLLLVCLLKYMPFNDGVLIDHSGHPNNYGLLEYTFDGPEIEVKSKPHGNSKQTTPYFHTSSTTKKRIQELAKGSTPKNVVHTITRQQGGEVQAKEQHVCLVIGSRLQTFDTLWPNRKIPMCYIASWSSANWLRERKMHSYVI